MHTRASSIVIAGCFLVAMLQNAVARDVDLSGFWEPALMEDYQATGPGPDMGDFTALPINEAGRTRALSYSNSQLSIPERQCIFYAPSYLVTGPFAFRFSAESDPLSGKKLAWRISPWIDRPELVIWMDGRPHPSEEGLHSFGGFATGTWEGNTLTVRVTHMKESPIRRNGVPTSDQASLTLHYTRHGDYLGLTGIIEDPVYLSEPYILSRVYRLNPTAYLQNDMVMTCVPSAEVVAERGTVPHILPGANTAVDEFAQRYGITHEAALGGAATAYPEYRSQLKDYRLPQNACNGYCCGWGDSRNPEVFNRIPILQCPGSVGTSPEISDMMKKPAKDEAE